jgi:polysaccharide biosynthesis transport protein
MNRNDTPQLLEYLRALKARWLLIVVLAAIAVAASLAVSLTSPKQYDATVDILLREQEPANTLLDPGATAASSDAERELKTNVELIKVASTAQAVRRRVGLTMSIDDLLEKVRTETTTDSNVVALTVRDRDPQLAARIANEFASAYASFRLASARRRYTEAANLAERQLSELSPEELASAQGRELQTRQRELQIAGALQTGGVEIVRPADVPKDAARPRPILSGVLSLFLGLVFGVCVALGLELFDRRLKDEGAVEAFFELPILGAIPRPPRRGGLDDHAQREAYGLLAANLRLSSGAHRQGAGRRERPDSGQVMMITSPGPGEGKTTVSFGVARACARLGMNVVLIEADLRRPAFNRFTDVNESRGITAVLEGVADFERELLWLDPETLLPSLGEGAYEGRLAILPCVVPPGNPQMLLSRSSMRDLVESARGIADVVLIDTAPVGTVNDPVTMARLVSGVVLVAKLNQTTKDAGRRALRVLRNVEIRLAGVVVTDAEETEQYSYYGPSGGGQPAESPGSPVPGAPSY